MEHPTHVTEATQLSNTVLCDILSHERRQYLLYCLDRYRTPIALADLADEVARLEHDAATLRQVPKDEVKRVYLDLYHTHIPKLDDAALLDYSQDRDAVHLTADLAALDLTELGAE